jgi:8-oxo-dGTP pyrophosphatase MutT (NUDIX family)
MLSGQESSYTSPLHKLPDIGNVPTEERKANYMKAIKERLPKDNTRFVFRSRNTEYSVQVPDGRYGFPKGGSNSYLDGGIRKNTALREFKEEVGYVIHDTDNVVYHGEKFGIHVYTYKVSLEQRHKIETAIQAQTEARYGELFNVAFRSVESIDKEVDTWNAKSAQVFRMLKDQLACSRTKGGAKGMLFNNTRKKQSSHLHYGTAAKAKQTLKYLRRRPHGEQVRSAQVMYYRAKHHANQTANMRNAMKVYGKFLNQMKNVTRKIRKQTGGLRIPIHSILMNKQIEKAILSVNPEFKFTGFKRDPTAPDFGSLPRWNSYKDRIANITDSEPIVVNKYKSTSYYQIQDGRHRFAQAILNGSDTVNVTII